MSEDAIHRRFNPFGSQRFWLFSVLFLILAVVTFVRLRLLQMPLERDEGEYAYAGQLLLQGVPPYLDLYSMKWPGVFGAYAIIERIFGQTASGIHLGLVLVNLGTAALVFLVSNRLCGKLAGVVAAGTYALLAIVPFTYGLAAHATHFVVLPVLGGVLLLLPPAERASRRRLFLAGLLLGLGAVMKQSGAAFGAFAAAWLVWQERVLPGRNARDLALRLGALAAGGVLPLALVCLLVWIGGTWDRFWLWTFEYSRAYASLASPLDSAHFLLANGGKILSGAPLLCCLPLAGLAMFFVEPGVKLCRSFISGLALFSWLACSAGGYFRGHYFLLVLPAAALLTGAGAEGCARLLQRAGKAASAAWVPLLAFGAVALLTVLLPQCREIFFRQSPIEACRVLYQSNPFPEAELVAQYLASHCPRGKRVAVLGSEPEIFFYSGLRSATAHIYAYPLMEPQPFAHEMQEEMIRQIAQAGPEYVVFVGVPSSWSPRADSDPTLLEWFQRYRAEHLKLAGLVETMPDYHIECTWDVPAGGLTPRTDRFLEVYRRK